MTGRGSTFCIPIRAFLAVFSVVLPDICMAGPNKITTLLRSVRMASPPGVFTNALVHDGELLIPDLHSGRICSVNLGTGEAQGYRATLGSRVGELAKPVAVFKTPGGFGVVDLKRARVVNFDSAWSFQSESSTGRPPASACFFYGPTVWLGDRLIGSGVVSADLCGGQERVYLFALRQDCKVTPLLWHQGPRDWREVTFVAGEGGLESMDGAGWLYVEPSRFEVSVFDAVDRMTRRFSGSREVWKEAAYATRPGPQDRAALIQWLDEQAFAYRPIRLGATHVGIPVQGPPVRGQVARFVEVYDVTTGLLVHREELPIPNDVGRLLVVASAGTGRLVALLRANRDPGAATEILDFRLDWPGDAGGARGVPPRVSTVSLAGH